MSKPLRDILSGVKSSTTKQLALGNKPDVDYDPKMSDARDFVGKHKIEKHDDRVGNGDDVYQATNISVDKTIRKS